ncbi:MAG: gamma-glutamyltransferase, partial [Bdellovibrionales bacterium]|nr:gamma-glutamyltransferase [Bdellovibrionales bacterium]
MHMKNIYLLFLLLTLFSCSTTQYKAVGKKYMIATQGRYSTAAGEKIFAQGGNIIDVAAAISFVISVERPQSTGIGGGGFMLFYNKKMTSPVAIDFRERAPSAA